MATPSLRAIYFTPRMMPLLAIGFSAGVPLMLTSRTLKLWARDAGVDLATVGLFSLVTLPYSLKFLWAPVMDRVVPPILGRRRGWLIITQLALIVAIAAMGASGPKTGESSATLFALLAVIVAFCSASQDIVADAYRTDVLSPREYGAGASIYITGYRIALLATGAGAVFLATMMAWHWVYLLCAAMMLVGVAATLLAPDPPADLPPTSFADSVTKPVGELVERHGWKIALILLFIVLFKTPDYMAAAMTDALLLDTGFTKEQIAFWALALGTAATIPGVIVGGFIASRFGLGTSLVAFGIAQALSNAGYCALAAIGPDVGTMIAVISVENFCAGLVAAGFTAFLMAQCNHRFSATQYALLSSLMGLSSSLAGAPTGYLVEQYDYITFFAITILAAAPGMLLLIPLLPHLRRVEISAAAISPAE